MIMNKIFGVGRRLTLLTVAAAQVGGMGCATYADLSQPDNTITKPGPVIATDTIVALGTPDAAMAEQIHNPHAVAFLGQTHTYLLVEGGERLLQFAHELDGNKLVLTSDSHSLFLRDNTVWGTLHFTYAPSGQAPAVEQETLRRLGFRLGANAAYEATVMVKGAVYPAMDFRGVGYQPLAQQRALQFRAPSTTETTPNLRKYALLPLTLGIDIVTSPIQLLGVAVYVLMVPHHDLH